MNNSVIQVPVFPLPFVVLPGEERGLHVFEPRYILLISECIVTNRLFGIPCTKGGKILGFGSLVRVSKVLRKYDDRRIDILIEGVGTFDLEGLMATETGDVYGTGMIQVNEEDHQPVSQGTLDAFFSAHQEITGNVPDPDDFSTSDIFRLAVKLPMNDEQKISLVSARTIIRRENQLQNLLQYLLLVSRQEARVKDRIFPN